MEPFDESVEAKETADRCLGISAGWVSSRFATPRRARICDPRARLLHEIQR